MDGGATSQTKPVSTVVRLATAMAKDGSLTIRYTGTFTYDRDDLGRPTSITHALAGVSSAVVMSQTFDLRGNRTQLAAQIGST